jgi:hypothetical protein
MLVGMSMSLPSFHLSDAEQLRVDCGLVHKQTRLDRLLRNKNSSSLLTFTKYGLEDFKSTDQGLMETNKLAYLLKHR